MSFINVTSGSGVKYRIDAAKQVGQGGEGVIYDIGNDIVAKIYHDGIEVLQQNKFDYLNKLDKNLFICPLELLYNGIGKSKNVVGFTMPYLKPEYFPLTNLYTKSFCNTNNIDNKIKLLVIDNLIKAVEYAHSMKIVIGDLNCLNIMVNNQGSIKLIDTDSYQTPGFKHSGRLLEDIRDFLYQGHINAESDFFALSVLTFNMLAYIHPFKGIHKQYLKIGDRMIHKMPVFTDVQNLKLPKCYEPIQDINLMSQFEKLYLKGERFIMSLNKAIASNITMVAAKPVLIKQYTQDQLTITNISGTQKPINVYCSESVLIIETLEDFIIYSAKNKSYVTIQDTVSKKDYEQVFLGEKNLFFKKNEHLFLYNSPGKFVKITSFSFPVQHLTQQYGNILLVVSHDNMSKLYLDEAIGGVVKSSITSVFGKGFKKYNSLIYNSGGRQNLFYNPRNIETSMISLPIKTEDLYQNKNVGIVQYLNNEIIKYKFFKIKDLKITFAKDEILSHCNFAFKQNQDGEGMIFVPADDKILCIRSQDFAQISELKCDLVSTDSILKNTTAGLILLEDNIVWLLNKK